MKIEIKTNKGNEFDIKDSIYSSSLGEYGSIALSFYNVEIQFGISYYPDKNMIVFQNEEYPDYWTNEKIKEVEDNLKNYLVPNYDSDDELPFDFDKVVNYILIEMDKFYDWAIEFDKEFTKELNKILQDV